MYTPAIDPDTHRLCGVPKPPSNPATGWARPRAQRCLTPMRCHMLLLDESRLRPLMPFVEGSDAHNIRMRIRCCAPSRLVVRTCVVAHACARAFVCVVCGFVRVCMSECACLRVHVSACTSVSMRACARSCFTHTPVPHLRHDRAYICMGTRPGLTPATSTPGPAPGQAHLRRAQQQAAGGWVSEFARQPERAQKYGPGPGHPTPHPLRARSIALG